jgi:hypothetical protein
LFTLQKNLTWDLKPKTWKKNRFDPKTSDLIENTKDTYSFDPGWRGITVTVENR